MNTANRVKLGAFLLISVILLVGSFLAIGVLNIFQPKFKAVTVLDTSIEGLSVGSQVKYLGLGIGRVTRVAMRQKDGYIVIYFDIFRSVIDSAQENSNVWGRDRFEIDDLIKRHNLSCFINAAGVMGGTYLELGTSKHNLPGLPQLNYTPPDGYTYIPSQPSHIGSAIQNISRLLEEVSKLNLVQMTDKANQALDNVSALFNQADLLTTMKNLNTLSRDLAQASENLQKALSESNLEKINKTVDSIGNTARQLEGFAEKNNLGNTLNNINDFLKDVRGFIGVLDKNGKEFSSEISSMRSQFSDTLQSVENTMVQLQDFTNRMEDNPEQFIRGRQEKKVLGK